MVPSCGCNRNAGRKRGRNLVVFVIALAAPDRHGSEQGGL